MAIHGGEFVLRRRQGICLRPGGPAAPGCAGPAERWGSAKTNSLVSESVWQAGKERIRLRVAPPLRRPPKAAARSPASMAPHDLHSEFPWAQLLPLIYRLSVYRLSPCNHFMACSTCSCCAHSSWARSTVTASQSDQDGLHRRARHRVRIAVSRAQAAGAQGLDLVEVGRH
jgi:hypothetical protein